MSSCRCNTKLYELQRYIDSRKLFEWLFGLKTSHYRIDNLAAVETEMSIFIIENRQIETLLFHCRDPNDLFIIEH